MKFQYWGPISGACNLPIDCSQTCLNIWRFFTQWNQQSWKDCIIQPSVARHELRWVSRPMKISTLKGLNQSAHSRILPLWPNRSEKFSSTSCSPPRNVGHFCVTSLFAKSCIIILGVFWPILNANRSSSAALRIMFIFCVFCPAPEMRRRWLKKSNGVRLYGSNPKIRHWRILPGKAVMEFFR